MAKWWRKSACNATIISIESRPFHFKFYPHRWFDSLEGPSGLPLAIKVESNSHDVLILNLFRRWSFARKIISEDTSVRTDAMKALCFAVLTGPPLQIRSCFVIVRSSDAINGLWFAEKTKAIATKNETFPSYFLQNLHIRAAAHFALLLDTVIWSINWIINLKTPRSRRLEKNIPFGYFDICTFSRISFRTNNFRVTRRVRDKKGYIFLMTNCFRSRLTMHQRRTPNFANEAAVDDSQQR